MPSLPDMRPATTTAAQQPSMFVDADLFDPRLMARSSDPSTSHEAARNARQLAQDHCSQILSAGKRFGHAGAEQLAAATRLDAYQVRKRLPELERAGGCRRTERTRRTASGRTEQVWEFGA